MKILKERGIQVGEPRPITNTPHFGQPNTNLGNVNSIGVFEPNSQFGQITSVLPSSNREGELGLRITF